MPTPPSTPPADWRMPAVVATSSGLSGAQAALAASQHSASAKTRPNFTVAAGGSEYVEWTVQSAGPAILSWLGQSGGTASVAKNGADQGFAPVFPSGSTIDGISGTGGRRQFARLTVAAGDTIRLTIAAGAAARTVYPLLHLKPASGPWDAHVFFGASREAQGQGCELIESSVIAANPARDPIVFNYAVSGQVLSQVVNNAATAAPIYDGVARYALLGSIIGNNVTSARPYDSGQKPAFDSAIASLMGSLAGFTIGFGNTSYRNYTGAPVSPPAAQEDGSKSYNDAVIHPAIQTHAADCYDAALGRSRIDEYLAILAARASLTDEVHGAWAEARALWTGSWFRRVYDGGWGGVTSQIETRIAAAEAAQGVKGTALAVFMEAGYALAALTASSAKAALQARLTEIEPTVYFQDAVRLIDAAVASALQADKDAAQVSLSLAASKGYSGGAAPNTLAAQQARLDAIVVVAVSKTVRVGFGSASALAGWNKTAATAAASPALPDLQKNDGGSSGWALNLTNGGTGNSVNAGLVSQVVDFPDAILANCLIDTANGIELAFTGLDNAKLYDISAMCSRVTSAGKKIKLQMNGGAELGDVDAANNVSIPITATNVAPVGGAITVLVKRGTGSSFVYLNGIVVREHS